MVDDGYTGRVPEYRISEASPDPKLAENSLAGNSSDCLARVSVHFISSKCKPL